MCFGTAFYNIYAESAAPPDHMWLENSHFCYQVNFHEEALVNDGQDLLHLKGTYFYSVNLTKKFLSLRFLK